LEARSLIRAYRGWDREGTKSERPTYL
jgi:hypothetical protein